MGLCISLSNKLCPATLDDETPSAVAPNSTSTTATTVPPVPQRVEHTDATGALIKPGNFSQKNFVAPIDPDRVHAPSHGVGTAYCP
jgi:hypothetical protein